MSTQGQQIAAALAYESRSTIETLKRIPADKIDWRPHTKSMTLGELSGHITDIPNWAETTVQTDKLEMEGKFEQWVGTTAEEFVARYENSLGPALRALDGVSDDEMAKPWALIFNGTTLFQMPKAAVLDSFIIKHLIHHRAQLGVYLRLLDVPVPSVYGPSADENVFGG